MGGALQSPFLGYVTAGRGCAAALSLSDGDLRLKIPSLEIAGSWRVVRFDQRGRVLEDAVTEGKEIFETRLKPYELAILEAKQKD
jgi:hypothetical protein